jgi:hypothetical protein
MKRAGCRTHLTKPSRRCPAGRLGVPVAALTLGGQAAGGGGKDGPAPPPPTPTKKVRPADILCVDGSAVKGTLLDSHLELLTPYGKLLIPVADVRKLEFRTRRPQDLARRIQAAVADLGHAEFKRRAAATAELRALQEKAYPALLRAAKAGDSETARRAAQLLARLRETTPEGRLEVRPHDVHRPLRGVPQLAQAPLCSLQFLLQRVDPDQQVHADARQSAADEACGEPLRHGTSGAGGRGLCRQQSRRGGGRQGAG